MAPAYLLKWWGCQPGLGTFPPCCSPSRHIFYRQAVPASCGSRRPLCVLRGTTGQHESLTATFENSFWAVHGLIGVQPGLTSHLARAGRQDRHLPAACKRPPHMSAEQPGHRTTPAACSCACAAPCCTGRVVAARLLAAARGSTWRARGRPGSTCSTTCKTLTSGTARLRSGMSAMPTARKWGRHPGGALQSQQARGERAARPPPLHLPTAPKFASHAPGCGIHPGRDTAHPRGEAWLGGRAGGAGCRCEHAVVVLRSAATASISLWGPRPSLGSFWAGPRCAWLRQHLAPAFGDPVCWVWFGVHIQHVV